MVQPLHRLALFSMVVLFYATVSSHAFLMPSVRQQQTTRLMRLAGVKKAGSGPSSASAGKGMGKNVDTSTPSLNWCPTPIPSSSIPTDEAQGVVLLETQLPSLKNGQTNPMGAIAVTKYDDQTYCFDMACPSCKIPMTKATCTTIPDPDDPDNYEMDVITCDFCKSTYDLQSGERQSKSAVAPGFLGGIAQTIFSTSEANRGPLKLYKLAEQGGKVLISFD